LDHELSTVVLRQISETKNTDYSSSLLSFRKLSPCVSRRYKVNRFTSKARSTLATIVGEFGDYSRPCGQDLRSMIMYTKQSTQNSVKTGCKVLQLHTFIVLSLLLYTKPVLLFEYKTQINIRSSDCSRILFLPSHHHLPCINVD